MEGTHISWASDTFNPLEGCEKVSEGCKNCYAEARDRRFHEGKHWGPGSSRLEHNEAYWRQPFKWDKQAALSGERRRVFCASLSDWLEDHPAWLKVRLRLLDVIRQTPNLEWLLLTKRIENFERLIEASARTVPGDDTSHDAVLFWLGEWFGVKPPENVRIGVTVENQAMANKRIPLLLKVPGQNFLSMGPLLEHVNLLEAMPCGYYCSEDHGHIDHSLNGLHEVIVEGESGPNARPMALEWAIDLRNQCRDYGIPFHFKQMGARPTLGGKPYPISDDKGGVWDEFPPELQVRELPGVVA